LADASFWNWKVFAYRGERETDMEHHVREQALAVAVHRVIAEARAWRGVEYGNEEPLMTEIGEAANKLKHAIDQLDVVETKK
jgi:hypothetical protein